MPDAKTKLVLYVPDGVEVEVVRKPLLFDALRILRPRWADDRPVVMTVNVQPILDEMSERSYGNVGGVATLACGAITVKC